MLNKDFANSGFSFVLVNTTCTVNDDWFKNAAPDTVQQDIMKPSLHEGGAADLNVYSVRVSADRTAEWRTTLRSLAPSIVTVAQ